MDPARLAKLMADEGVSISAGVPTIWQGLKQLYEANPGNYDLSNLNRLTCGGSAPPPSLVTTGTPRGRAPSRAGPSKSGCATRIFAPCPINLKDWPPSYLTIF